MSSADRVRKLAALAGSDNVFEANEAARQACRLIREGKVRVMDLPPEPAAPSEWTAHPWHASRRAAHAAPPRPPRPRPRGPFARKPAVYGVECAACREEIPLGEAFSCTDGFVHGDCVPASDRP